MRKRSLKLKYNQPPNLQKINLHERDSYCGKYRDLLYAVLSYLGNSREKIYAACSY